jgi:antitoxin component YwqK of YwqJK toxin-antitoxin module
MSCSLDKDVTPTQLNGVINHQIQDQSYTGVIVGYYRTVEQKKYEELYRNGIKNGIYKSWFKNGRLKTIGKYTNNLRVGIWKWFNENGEISYVFNYSKA